MEEQRLRDEQHAISVRMRQVDKEQQLASQKALFETRQAAAAKREQYLEEVGYRVFEKIIDKSA